MKELCQLLFYAVWNSLSYSQEQEPFHATVRKLNVKSIYTRRYIAVGVRMSSDCTANACKSSRFKENKEK